MIWLVVASLFFYGWWKPEYLVLLVASKVANYSMGLVLSRTSLPVNTRKLLLGLGIAGNLLTLAYFKYANFIVDNLNLVINPPIIISEIILPLGISFFTFQQIAYLVDAFKKETEKHNFLHYALFVTFFPQLIAGPIVHHREMMIEFERHTNFRIRADDISIGLTIFFIGLFKKVVLADNVALFSTPIFAASAVGTPISIMEAWGGALAYTCQLYFDFSGYADMAIGASRLFSIRLPQNFYSPYKSVNIVEFWRRWHMTLSRFLRDYLYIALGGNRKGPAMRHVNLMVTMILGGIWHGAGWTYLIWGFLHGSYLVINHAWSNLVTARVPGMAHSVLWRCFSWLMTFVAVVVAWVYFRAETLTSANEMVASMFGLNGISLPETMGSLAPVFMTGFLQFDAQLILSLGEWVQGTALILFLLGIAVFAPNTQQIMIAFNPVIESAKILPGLLQWRPNWKWALSMSTVAVIAVINANDVSEFLYFQF